MFSLDFLVTILVIYGIMRIVRMINAPQRRAVMQTRQQQHPQPPHREAPPPEHVSPVRGEIVDATFEEID